MGSKISSIETDVNLRLAKAENAIDRLLFILKSDQSDEIKLDFVQAVAVFILLYGYSKWILRKRIDKKLDFNNTRMLRGIFRNPSNTPQNSSYVATYLSSHKPFKQDKPNIRDTAGKAKENS